MSHVFISYSKKDRAYARALADKLQSLGFDVWIDDRIDYGTDWWRTIVRAIRSANAFVVIMSAESDSSEWVQREVTLADKNKIPPFPLWLSDDFHASENWAIYVRTQYADVTDGRLPPDEFYERLSLVVPRKTIEGQNITPTDKQSVTTTLELKPEDSTTPVLNIDGSPQHITYSKRRLLFALIGLVGIALFGILALLNSTLFHVPEEPTSQVAAVKPSLVSATALIQIEIPSVIVSNTTVPISTDTLFPTVKDTSTATPTSTLFLTVTNTVIPTPTNTLFPTVTDTSTATLTSTLSHIPTLDLSTLSSASISKKQTPDNGVLVESNIKSINVTCPDGTEIRNGVEVTVNMRPNFTYTATAIGKNGYDPVIGVGDSKGINLCQHDDLAASKYSINLPSSGLVNVARTNTQMPFYHSNSGFSTISLVVGSTDGSSGEFVMVLEGMAVTTNDGKGEGAGDPYAIHLTQNVIDSGVPLNVYMIAKGSNLDPFFQLVHSDNTVVTVDGGSRVECDNAGTTTCWGDSQNLSTSYVSNGSKNILGIAADAMMSIPVKDINLDKDPDNNWFNFLMTSSSQRTLGEYIVVFHIGIK